MPEFDLIHEFFFWEKIPASVQCAGGDDAAVLRIPQGQELIVSVDTLNAGVHFPMDTPAHAIGHKALAVNLSDLAAMGAQPAWFTLALSMPSVDRNWLAAFSQGMRELAEQHNIFLIGGDTTQGPLSITIQVMGFSSPQQALLRSGASPGDLLCVTGSLGDAAAGLAVLQGCLTMPAAAAEFCVQRLNYPQPRNTLREVLLGRASACMDISDGLLADLQHLLAASQLGARVFHQQVPLSSALQELPMEQALNFALRGGDDYELLFTLPEKYFIEVNEIAKICQIPLTIIGQAYADIVGLSIDWEFADKRLGYEHFSTN